MMTMTPTPTPRMICFLFCWTQMRVVRMDGLNTMTWTTTEIVKMDNQFKTTVVDSKRRRILKNHFRVLEREMMAKNNLTKTPVRDSS